MKLQKIKFKIILGLILIPINLIGQNSKWHEFDLQNIKVDFPTEEVFQLDTILKGIRINQLYSQIGNSTLIVQKLPAESNTINKNLSSLPYDYESLIKYYEGVIEGVRKSSKAKEVIKEEIKIKELIGYKSIIYNKIEEPIMESRIFLAGNDLIMISIYNPTKELNDIKATFFNSMKLGSLDSLEQYTGKSKAYKQGYIFGKIFFYIIAFSAGIFFLIRTLKRKK
ncbi:MAG: hypothetical protein HWD85_05400 [Flavobacteriaceae bacterium]|nr:hypothetical protein [Flavobacteriaceae bacterium]